MAILFIKHLPACFDVYEDRDEVFDAVASADEADEWVDFRTKEGPIVTLRLNSIAAVVGDLK